MAGISPRAGWRLFHRKFRKKNWSLFASIKHDECDMWYVSNTFVYVHELLGQPQYVLLQNVVHEHFIMAHMPE